MNSVPPVQAPHGGTDAGGAVPHDFSTNANACGPCPAAAMALQQVDASRYPDPGYTALRESLGSFHGVPSARILIAASASEFIGRITAAVAQAGGRRALLPAHSYGDYWHAADGWGLQARREPATQTGADLVWFCDPSSPLGQPQADLASRIEELDAGSVGVLDLAYEPLRLEGQLALEPSHADRVWQLWTPNKALGLTGVRAAYAIAPRGACDMQARIERLAPSWPVGAHGVALLAAWTTADAQHWLAQSRDCLRAWKQAQRAMCESLGWTCLPSVANYFCARPDRLFPDHPAALRSAGIKLRDASDFGLAGHVRLGVLPPESQQALRAAWRALR